MKYNTFLFDFDYTLVNSSAGIVKCFRIVLEQHEHLNISDEDIKRTIGKTLEESFSILTGITDAETLHIYRREYVTEADKYMTDNTFLFPETKNVLAKLKESGAKIGIISTKYKYRIQQFLDLNFPKDFFDIIIGLEEVENYKPAPDGILKAIKTLKSKKRETIYIGDSTADAGAAQNAEVDFMGVTHGVTTTRELAVFQNVAIAPDLSILLTFIDKKEIKNAIRKGKWDFLKRYFKYRLHNKAVKSIDPYKHYVCRNCGTYFTGEYCNNCGQARNTQRLTFSYIIKNALGGMTNIDEGFMRNLIELLYRPGYMIYDYINGKRSHYFKPFQTLFVLVAIYIIIAKLIDPFSFINEQDPTFSTVKEDIRTIRQNTDSEKTKQLLDKSCSYIDSAYQNNIVDEKENIENLNINITGQHDIKKSISKVIDKANNGDDNLNTKENPSIIQALFTVIRNWATDNKALSLICLIPFYALATKRAFRKNKISQQMNYTEHLFAQVYIACQMVLISIILLPFAGHEELDDAFGISWWMIFLLYWWDYYQLFRESGKKTLRNLIMMFVNLILIIILLAILLIIIIVIVALIIKVINPEFAIQI